MPTIDKLGSLSCLQDQHYKFTQILSRTRVVASSLVKPIKSWNDQIHPSHSSFHLGFKTSPFTMIPWRTMHGQDCILGIHLVIGDHCIPTVTDIHLYQLRWWIYNFDFGSHLNVQYF